MSSRLHTVEHTGGHTIPWHTQCHLGYIQWNTLEDTPYHGHAVNHLNGPSQNTERVGVDTSFSNHPEGYLRVGHQTVLTVTFQNSQCTFYDHHQSILFMKSMCE